MLVSSTLILNFAGALITDAFNAIAAFSIQITSISEIAVASSWRGGDHTSVVVPLSAYCHPPCETRV